MVTYEAVFTPQRSDVLDGTWRRVIKVTLTRYDTPTSKGAKAGSTTVKAFTKQALRRAAKCAADDLKRVDQNRRRAEIIGRIDRIVTAQLNLSRE